MQKGLSVILAVLRRVIFIGFSIQIVIGLFWLCSSFGDFQEFGESYFYLELSESLVCDKYTGILYPAFLSFAKVIEKLCKVPYYITVYMIQLGVAGYSAYTFLRKFSFLGNIWRIVGTLAILTIPMAMQCHLAVLPYSFVHSFLFLELAFCFESIFGQQAKESISDEKDFRNANSAISADEKKHFKKTVSAASFRVSSFIKMVFCWAVAVLFLPEYVFFGAIPVLFTFLYNMIFLLKHKKVSYFIFEILMIIVFIGAVWSIQYATQQKEDAEDISKSIEISVCSRFAWSSLRSTYENWPEELKEIVSEEELLQYASDPNKMFTMFAPTIESAVGTERAKELFAELSKIAWNANKGKILRQTVWDAVGYTLSPVAHSMLLKGRGYESYAGRNYDIMRQNKPVLTEYYINYSGWWFAAGVGLAGVLQLLHLLKKPFPINKKSVLSLIICMLTAGSIVLFYSLRGGGIMDYKASLTVIYLWTAWMVLL